MTNETKVVEQRIIQRLINTIADYEEGGKFYSQVIPLHTQAYAIYDLQGKVGLYYVFGDGVHTYTEIRDGQSSLESAHEYAVFDDAWIELINSKADLQYMNFELSKRQYISNLVNEITEENEKSTTLYPSVKAVTTITNTLQDNIDQEASNRAQADNDLHDALENEKSTRINADNDLSDAIEQEGAVRAEKDLELSQDISTEITNRQNADNNLNTAITNENNRALGVEAALSARIDVNDSEFETIKGEESVTGSMKAIAKSYSDNAYNSAVNYTDTREEFIMDTLNTAVDTIEDKEAELAADIVAENTRATNAEESLDNNKADKSNVYTKAEIDAKLTSAMRFKGTKPTYNDLPKSNNEVGDMWNILDDGTNYAWDGENWDKLSETIDLTPYATKEEVSAVDEGLQDNIDTEANTREANDNYIDNKLTGFIRRIWQNYDETDASKGWFYTKYNLPSKSYSLVFNENDGGGIQVFDKTANVISYVGANLEEGNSDKDSAINVQIYSKDKTSNEGVRLNISSQKAYYLKGANKTNVPEREIAVIENIPTKTSDLTNDSDYTTNEALQAQVTSLTNQIKELKLLIPQEVFNPTTARSAMNASGKVTLCEDIDLGVLNLGGGMFANYNTSINLNGHTLQSGPTGGRALLLVRGTSNYTFNGKGQVIDTADDSSPVWCASQNASVTINDGTFIAQGHTETIYCELGTITINGGEFKTEVEDKRYLLNCKDANYQSGTAKIIVKGGKFWDFDPHDCAAEGEHTNFCADGYTTTSEIIDGHTVYTVVKA